MKKIYIIRKYVPAETIESAIRKEKKIPVTDAWLTEYSTTQHLSEISPKQ